MTSTRANRPTLSTFKIFPHSFRDGVAPYMWVPSSMLSEARFERQMASSLAAHTEVPSGWMQDTRIGVHEHE